MKPFLDANIIVNAFFENKDQERCRQVLSEEFVTDMLCLAEAQDALTAIIKNREQATFWVKSVFKANGIVLDIDKNILIESFKHLDRLRVLDAIHYAAALLNGCSEFLSYDKDFNTLSIKRVEP